MMKYNEWNIGAAYINGQLSLLYKREEYSPLSRICVGDDSFQDYLDWEDTCEEMGWEKVSAPRDTHEDDYVPCGDEVIYHDHFCGADLVVRPVRRADEVVADAIATTKELLPDYWQATLSQRLPGGAGSVVEGVSTTQELESRLMSAHWRTYEHPDIMPGCKAFYTYDVSGELGVVELSSLEPDAMVTLDDRKGTGKVSCTVTGAHGRHETFTVLIVGEEQGRDVVFTFHPGAPVRPSVVQTEPGMHGRACAVAEAMAMGLTTAKIVR